MGRQFIFLKMVSERKCVKYVYCQPHDVKLIRAALFSIEHFFFCKNHAGTSLIVCFLVIKISLKIKNSFGL